ncbi:MAG: TIGR02444 family protein [Asticcacaulis sp.]
MTDDFWDWAVRVYATPAVAEACLELQDTHDQCVPLLLFGLWTEAQGYVLNEDLSEAAVDTARAWSEHVIAPLRGIRRRIKGPVSDMDDAAKSAIREQVKAAELAAEKALMAALEGLMSTERSQTQAGDNLVRLARSWSPVVPRTGLKRLRDALS